MGRMGKSAGMVSRSMWRTSQSVGRMSMSGKQCVGKGKDDYNCEEDE